MKWSIEDRNGAVLVTMRSNRVNKMNPELFDDLHQALDLVEERHPRLPLVLTAEGTTFSAGLDFEDAFPRFASADLPGLGRWLERFRSCILRVFTLPRRTIAAINGNAFAGGLILALGCDVRLAAHDGGARFAINEVPVGIPMPGVYTEIVRHAVGTRAAAEAILSGRIYDTAQALAIGFVHQLVPASELVDEALRHARMISPDCATAYAASKHALQAPALDQIARAGDEMNALALRAVTAPDSLRAQEAAFARLKKR